MEPERKLEETPIGGVEDHSDDGERKKAARLRELVEAENPASKVRLLFRSLSFFPRFIFSPAPPFASQIPVLNKGSILVASQIEASKRFEYTSADCRKHPASQETLVFHKLCSKILGFQLNDSSKSTSVNLAVFFSSSD